MNLLFVHISAHCSQERKQCLVKDTLQTEASDVRLDEVQVFVSVVVLLLQRADGVTLRSDKKVSVIRLHFSLRPWKYKAMTFPWLMTFVQHM